jgi:hypothetical protein
MSWYIQMMIIDGSERIIWSMWIMLSYGLRYTALRSTPELASPGVKISFLFKGFLLLFPIRDPIEFSWR